MRRVPHKYNVGDIIGNWEVVARSWKWSGDRYRKLYTVRCLKCDSIMPCWERSLHANTVCHECNFKYEVGQQVGDLKILERLRQAYGMAETLRKAYDVKCMVCGRRRVLQEGNLVRGLGLYHSACAYGFKDDGSRFHTIWNNMVQRIGNQNHHSYDRYGGRGLTTDFALFVDFFDYMYATYVEHANKYGEFNTTLERINNDLGYVRGNIRWATWDEQGDNTSRTVYFKYISPTGETGIAGNTKEFAREHVLPLSSVSDYLSGSNKTCHGWHFSRITKEEYDEESFRQLLHAKLSVYSDADLMNLVKGKDIAFTSAGILNDVLDYSVKLWRNNQISDDKCV